MVARILARNPFDGIHDHMPTDIVLIQSVFEQSHLNAKNASTEVAVQWIVSVLGRRQNISEYRIALQSVGGSVPPQILFIVAKIFFGDLISERLQPVNCRPDVFVGALLYVIQAAMMQWMKSIFFRQCKQLGIARFAHQSVTLEAWFSACGSFTCQ